MEEKNGKKLKKADFKFIVPIMNCVKKTVLNWEKTHL